MKWIAVFFTFLCASLMANHAAQDIRRRYISSQDMRKVGGRLFPTTVDLTPEFPANEECQFGGTCHIYTATGLFGHACYRVTGKWLNLDEGYLFALHVYEFFKVIPFDEKGFKGGVSYETYLAWRKYGALTVNDGGNPKDSIDRICSGNCVVSGIREGVLLNKSGGRMPWNELGELYEEKLTAALKNNNFREFHKKWMEFFEIMLKNHGAKESANKTLTVTPPAELKECLEGRKWDFQSRAWDPELAHALIAKGVPFACAGNYSGPSIRGIDASHVTVVTGYEMSKEPGGPTLWKIRGADGRPSGTLQMPIESCANMQYVGLPVSEPSVY